MDTTGVTSRRDPELKFRCPQDTVAKVKRNAERLGITMSEYIRTVLTEEAQYSDANDRFVEAFTAWWGLNGQGDPAAIMGARARAAGAGVAFHVKLRNALRMLLDQSIL